MFGVSNLNKIKGVEMYVWCLLEFQNQEPLESFSGVRILNMEQLECMYVGTWNLNQEFFFDECFLELGFGTRKRI